MGELDKVTRIWIRDSIVFGFQALFRKKSERLKVAPMEMKDHVINQHLVSNYLKIFGTKLNII